jgi:hypothetical protein
MYKISKKMKKIAKKLSDNGHYNRAEQFMILAENLEKEIKMEKISNINIIPKIAPQKKYHINEDELKEIFNKPLTPYQKYKE